MPPTILCRRKESSKPPDAKSFIRVAGTRPLPIAGSRAWFAYDDDFLYATYDFDEPSAASLPRKEPELPQKPWTVDSGELSIWAPRQALMYKFIVDSLGNPWARVYKLVVTHDPVQRGRVLHDWRERELAVPGGEFKACIGKGRWELRMKIPWRVLGSRKPRTDLAILFGRNRQHAKVQLSSWPAAFHFVVGGARDGFARLRLEGLKPPAGFSEKARPPALTIGPAIRPAAIPSEEIIIGRNAGMFPVAAKLADGSIGVVARDGAGYIGAGGYLRFWRSTDEGRTWSDPTIVSDGGPRADHRNPAFGQMADGTLVASYCHSDNCYDEAGHWVPGAEDVPIVNYRLSKDMGKTWGPARPLVLPRDPRLLSPFGKIVVLPDGTAVMAVYGQGSYIVRSRDNGRTWGDVSLIGHGLNETALLWLPSGRLLAAPRGGKGERLFVTESPDHGCTWTEPKELAGERQIPADLIRLETGEIILTHGYRHVPFGVRVFASLDDARTWRPRKSVAIVWWAHGDCGYPSSVELSGGRILSVYYSVRSRRDLTLGIFVGGVIYKKADLLKTLKTT